MTFSFLTVKIPPLFNLNSFPPDPHEETSIDTAIKVIAFFTLSRITKFIFALLDDIVNYAFVAFFCSSTSTRCRSISKALTNSRPLDSTDSNRSSISA